MKNKENKKQTKTRQGINMIPSDADIFGHFSNEDTEKEPGKSFSEMLEESFSDESNLNMIKEKSSESSEDKEPGKSNKLDAYPDPQDEIDLHGLTAEETELKTDFFIRDSKAKGLSTIRIIVGKGTHSKGRAVLPDVVEKKIVDLKRNGQVLTFKWEKGKKLSSGALIVYLTSKSKKGT